MTIIIVPLTVAIAAGTIVYFVTRRITQDRFTRFAVAFVAGYFAFDILTPGMSLMDLIRELIGN